MQKWQMRPVLIARLPRSGCRYPYPYPYPSFHSQSSLQPDNERGRGPQRYPTQQQRQQQQRPSNNRQAAAKASQDIQSFTQRTRQGQGQSRSQGQGQSQGQIQGQGQGPRRQGLRSVAPAGFAQTQRHPAPDSAQRSRPGHSDVRTVSIPNNSAASQYDDGGGDDDHSLQFDEAFHDKYIEAALDGAEDEDEGDMTSEEMIGAQGEYTDEELDAELAQLSAQGAEETGGGLTGDEVIMEEEQSAEQAEGLEDPYGSSLALMNAVEEHLTPPLKRFAPDTFKAEDLVNNRVATLAGPMGPMSEMDEATGRLALRDDTRWVSDSQVARCLLAGKFVKFKDHAERMRITALAERYAQMTAEKASLHHGMPVEPESVGFLPIASTFRARITNKVARGHYPNPVPVKEKGIKDRTMNHLAKSVQMNGSYTPSQGKAMLDFIGKLWPEEAAQIPERPRSRK
ncbi:hypothetical protein EJ08DRAFT_666710 [Tothia fuscella]|uniref:Uncharacterized protein n=1 Tax=Tothia fuscella TaxID=1048955 RepID=A0A9P4TSI9_9PEZI|nr:hypothetical protein EJ08DRAFT_666710 [Tothia fuscella]